MDETHLIQRARQGDMEAFNCLVLVYQDLVFQHVFWTLGEPEAAENLTQQTFLLAFQQLDAFRDGDFGGWLLTMACGRCIKALRRRDSNHSSIREVHPCHSEAMDATILDNRPTGEPVGHIGKNYWWRPFRRA